ncbi:hypothetical protein FQR65_LT11050 [Abscondita terminalis]|nr:hypothetical protein FQR65_LT11050 [Abscondita terminalis]
MSLRFLEMDLKFGFTLQTLTDRGRINPNDIELLRASFKTKVTDELLALFLMSCENDRDRAKCTAEKYFEIRQMAPEIFSNRSVTSEALQNQLRVGAYSILTKRTPNNCAVMVLKLQDSDYRKFDVASHFKLICMTLDSVTYFDPPEGLIGVMDLQGTSFMHLTVVKLALVKTFTRYVQEALPLKLKAVHLFNGGYVLSALFNLFKPFLKKEVKEMMHFYPNAADMNSFYTTWLGKEFLPEEFGGDLPPVAVHQEDTVEKLKLMQTYFETDERQTREFFQ